jgi:hypothetical protein
MLKVKRFKLREPSMVFNKFLIKRSKKHVTGSKEPLLTYAADIIRLSHKRSVNAVIKSNKNRRRGGPKGEFPAPAG